jgi:hypothetical protein
MITTFCTVERIKENEIAVFDVNQEHKPVVVIDRGEIQLDKNIKINSVRNKIMHKN